MRRINGLKRAAKQQSDESSSLARDWAQHENKLLSKVKLRCFTRFYLECLNLQIADLSDRNTQLEDEIADVIERARSKFSDISIIFTTISELVFANMFRSYFVGKVTPELSKSFAERWKTP